VAGQTYLQVVASTRPDCEIIVDVLKRKGFAALIAPGPSDKLFRVLVGPLNDTAAIAKARTDLEQAGFQKPYLRKY
jgi:cell division septation protein DedD